MLRLQAGLKHRKLGSSMSQQDSGNMLLLLSAVEDVKSMDRSAAEAKRQSGEAPRSHIALTRIRERLAM